LTSELIKDIPSTMKSYDFFLRNVVGYSLFEIATAAADADHEEMREKIGKSRIGIIPITSGQGVIEGFSDAIKAILEYMGADAFITKPDVVGLAEAVEKGADMIFAGDDELVALINLNTREVVPNYIATGYGFAQALCMAVGGCKDRDVLVIGAGKVGRAAIELLKRRGANVLVYDVKDEEIEGVVRVKSVEEGIKKMKNVKLIVEATPSKDTIRGELLDGETYISAPGVPLGVDEVGISKAKVVIHDVLQIGVATMLTLSLR
jgi:pyrrolysine biosynthesis protein PylD